MHDTPTAVTTIVRRIWSIFLRYGIVSILPLSIFAATWYMLIWKDIFLELHSSNLHRILSPACYTRIELDLITKSEIEKLNSAAATTLVTLLPALMTCSPFPMARIKHLVAYSTGSHDNRHHDFWVSYCQITNNT